MVFIHVPTIFIQNNNNINSKITFTPPFYLKFFFFLPFYLILDLCISRSKLPHSLFGLHHTTSLFLSLSLSSLSLSFLIINNVPPWLSSSSITGIISFPFTYPCASSIITFSRSFISMSPWLYIYIYNITTSP